MWWTRFEAFAAVKEFDDIIESGSTRLAQLPPTYADGKAIDPTAGATATARAENKLKKQLWKQNNLAMAYFTLAFKTASLMRMVTMAKNSATYPNGEAHLVLDALEKQYRPQDMTSKAEM